MDKRSQSGGRYVGVTMRNSIGMKLVLIPAGQFLMGSPECDRDAYGDEMPQRRVVISRPFLCGVYPVTEHQYMLVTGKSPRWSRSPSHPVDGVTWYEAVDFCNALSKREGLRPWCRCTGRGDEQARRGRGPGYRLPTEAEWEYACRAGASSPYFFGGDKRLLKKYAVHCANVLCGFLAKGTQPCGTKLPNPWGLYDVYGNVWEWCNDWYDAYPPNSPVVDPNGPSSGIGRVVRGGAWYDLPRDLRSANRGFAEPDIPFAGFRVVRTWSYPAAESIPPGSPRAV